MKTMLSLFTVVYMLLTSFFSGFSAPAKDLSPVENNKTEITLTAEQKSLLTDIFESEPAWLASLQLENGAIPMTTTENGNVSVNPYFADVAALALLDNADKYADNVKKYMDWHFAHLNTKKTDYNGTDGTIYDYTITIENGKVIAENITVKDGQNVYDSTDSYAATFLTVINKYYEKTSDLDYILSHADEISRIAEAMLSTFHFGLTFAKPDYEVKFLMDNCEVYEGALAATALLQTIGNTDFSSSLLLKKCELAAQTLAQKIENKLWNADGNHYHAGIFKNGDAAYTFTWDEFYPSATAQLFPVVHHVISADSVRANALYEAFCAHYDWQNFGIPSDFCWGSNVLAAAMMGDTDSVVTYMTNYLPKTQTHDYPLYNADIARVAMAAKILLTNAQ